MDQAKIQFLANEFIPLLKELPADAKGKWGKMNAQQMTEHLSVFFKVSTEKFKFPLVTPVEHLSKYKEFLLSDKEFRENTKAPGNVVPEEPMPVKNTTMNEALDELQHEVNDFIIVFETHPEMDTTHPVFGALNFDEWVLLHYKHVTHHLRQFGVY
jgi:hypothetical protein